MAIAATTHPSRIFEYTAVETCYLPLVYYQNCTLLRDINGMKANERIQYVIFDIRDLNFTFCAADGITRVKFQDAGN